MQAFWTDNGVMVPAVTAAQMRRIDRIAVEETGPNLFQMMENAGRTLAQTVIAELGTSWGSTRILVLAGTGGNGGGGICAARHLANRGAAVTVVVTDREALSPVSRFQLDVFVGTDGTLTTFDDVDHIGPGIVVDAVLGYSLSGAPKGRPAELIDWIASADCPVVSLDVPSGIDATTGLAPGIHVRAATTLTLALPKTGLDVSDVGKLVLADIGIPRGAYVLAGIEVPGPIFGDAYRVGLRHN